VIHRRLRALVSPAFTKRRTDALKPRIEAISTELLDRMAELPGGRADLRAAGPTYERPTRIRCRCASSARCSGIAHGYRENLNDCVNQPHRSRQFRQYRALLVADGQRPWTGTYRWCQTSV
jgi:hypothetical protein